MCFEDNFSTRKRLSLWLKQNTSKCTQFLQIEVVIIPLFRLVLYEGKFYFCRLMKAYQTAAYYTLGCKLNFSETSTIARNLAESGYAKVDFERGADVYVINTCSVTDNADKKCRNVVRRAQKYNPEAKVVVLGCYAQLKPEEI